MNILLIHTGGTIGMAETAHGLAPKAGLVEAAMTARLSAEHSLVQHVFAPLIDSADIGPQHWNRMLDLIDAHPDAPVIITHGTDTMSFTGAALAQALHGAARRVVLCGSMKPLGFSGDAEGNLDLALKTALTGPDRGVFLCFAGQVLPAEGLVKQHSSDLDAFQSIPQASLDLPQTRRFLPLDLAILTLSPAMSSTALTAILEHLDGAVLRVFGAGTAMSDPKVLDAIKRATAQGKRIRAVSQCMFGGLEPGTYAAGAPLWAAGVENGAAETPEAALIHLWLS
ncbi:L-asparaginase [Pacificibacter maritimus]|uniref:L-asparaginase n=1 Tax=Pacificibacter maritimus TaxID=762213 RepID=A0A3N4UBP1_9RHOB|nr:asparaginase domain-containing protein [Pacificibacter maritimus]RPE67228.1 L-asparaginase [Pacificibacter maritimus]